MKKFTAIFAMALMLPMSLLFVSCDEDAEVAYHLDGAWRGNMYVKTAYGGRTYTATYSEIEFYSGYNSGTGVWVDYYSGAPYDYVANHIRWAVRDGNIYIHFVEENIDAIISNYSLGTYDFSGRLEVRDGDYANFHLTHISSPNWSDYRYGWEYWSKQQTYFDGTRASSTQEIPVRLFVK